MLARIPPGWRKSPLFRDLNLAQVLALQKKREDRGVARFVMPGTVRKWWSWVKALFNWAIINKDTDANYARAVKVNVKRRIGRRAFSDDELRAIFESGFFRPGGYRRACDYWDAVLGYFTGARCNELAQTPLAAIKRDPLSGVVWIDVRREFGFKLKNDYSERELPIHPHIAESFWIYAQTLRARGETRFFYETPEGGRDGPGRHFSRHVNEKLLPALGVKTPGLVLHSLRHSLVQRLEAAGVEDKWVRRLVGHRGSTSLAIYGGKPPHDVLYERLVHAPFPATVPPFVDPTSTGPRITFQLIGATRPGRA
jgi:integrase